MTNTSHMALWRNNEGGDPLTYPVVQVSPQLPSTVLTLPHPRSSLSTEAIRSILQSEIRAGDEYMHWLNRVDYRSFLAMIEHMHEWTSLLTAWSITPPLWRYIWKTLCDFRSIRSIPIPAECVADYKAIQPFNAYLAFMDEE